MSAVAEITVQCDWPDCLHSVETGRRRVADAVNRVSEHGWKTAAGMHFCGPAPEGSTFLGALGARDHAAALADHTPQVKQVKTATGYGRGMVVVSCSCATMEANISTRDYAPYHWRRHVREAVGPPPGSRRSSADTHQPRYGAGDTAAVPAGGAR